MASDRTMKKGDTWPPLRSGLTETNLLGSVVAMDLTAASRVEFVMRQGATVFAATMAISSALGGRVQYQWANGDTDIIGDWACEFEVYWSSGFMETVPNTGTRTLSIEEDSR